MKFWLLFIVYLYPVMCYPSDPYVIYSSHEPAVPHFRPENLVNFTQCSEVKGIVLSWKYIKMDLVNLTKTPPNAPYFNDLKKEYF